MKSAILTTESKNDLQLLVELAQKMGIQVAFLNPIESKENRAYKETLNEPLNPKSFFKFLA